MGWRGYPLVHQSDEVCKILLIQFKSQDSTSCAQVSCSSSVLTPNMMCLMLMCSTILLPTPLKWAWTHLMWTVGPLTSVGTAPVCTPPKHSENMHKYGWNERRLQSESVSNVQHTWALSSQFSFYQPLTAIRETAAKNMHFDRRLTPAALRTHNLTTDGVLFKWWCVYTVITGALSDFLLWWGRTATVLLETSLSCRSWRG